jgi:hypothetical protein
MRQFKNWLFTPIGACCYFGVGYSLAALLYWLVM